MQDPSDSVVDVLAGRVTLVTTLVADRQPNPRRRVASLTQ